jgi:hypothetical protein
VATDTEIVRQVARAPMRTARLKDIRADEANLWRVVDRLVDEGALTRLVHGIYAAPPDGRDGRTWRPPLEAAALAVATARFGQRQAALMGVSAARHWAAIPRAIGVATVAVPRAGYAPTALDTGGRIRFVPRDLDQLDLVVERTALGEGFVTTPAQTLFDLLSRPQTNDAPMEAGAAVPNLAARVSAPEFEEIVVAARKTTTAARLMLKELKERDGPG